MTKKQLYEDLDRLRDKLHYGGYDAERIVEAIFQEARAWESSINPDLITDKEIEDYLQQDSIVKDYLYQYGLSIGELVDSLGLRRSRHYP